jgi:prepilin-type N-terminal cleavage/methylation domain-containing protein
MRRAFTLIELLVVIAIVAILAAILFPVFARAKLAAKKTACLSNLMQVGKAAIMYTTDNDGLFPWVPDSDLQLTPPVNSGGKRYCGMGSFMPPLHPYIKNVRVWECPPAPIVKSGSWMVHFSWPWRESGVDYPDKGWSNYISDKLAYTDPANPRYLRARAPELVADAIGTGVSQEEWLMSPFFERSWWAFAAPLWTVGGSVPPQSGWSAHFGGRNQLYLDMHARWVKKDIE